MNKKINDVIESWGPNQWYVWGGLALILLFELFGRSYLFNKIKIKIGYNWAVALINRKNYKKMKLETCNEIEKNFVSKNPKPVLSK